MDKTSSLSDNVAISALAVSLVALLVVILQLLQTIIASARGYESTDDRVLGKWSAYKTIVWRFFRVEVQYRAPVIFLAHSDNKKGAVDEAGVPIWYADGSNDSCRLTGVDIPPDEDHVRFTPEGVRTVNNELATWVTLIGAIQKMERDSKSWEAVKWGETGARQPDLPKVTTLAVGIQSVKRRFNSHPEIKRPYATTTICHLVELAAVLGIYWKEFNRDKNKYYAEGNGYSLLGTRLSNFGIVFVFERTGKPNFKATRVIPTCEIKELSFGNVPTFYRPRGQTDEEGWSVPFNEQRDLRTLQLGSRKEIGETLGLIGCNTQTSLYYLREGKKHIHLFPVTFEIVGMLGRTLHIKDRCFTYIPNPTIFPWNRQSFSLRRLLKAFRSHLSAEVRRTFTVPQELKTIHAQAELLDSHLPPDQDSDYEPRLLNELHHALDEVDAILDINKIPKNIVLDVLRRHLQEVLLAVNTSTANEPGLWPATALNTPTSQRVGGVPEQEGNASQTLSDQIVDSAISFDDLLSLPPENREKQFMEKYFNEIRHRVINTDSTTHHDPQAADASRKIHRASPQRPQQPQQDSQGQSQHQNLSYNTSETPPPSQSSPEAETPLPPSPIATEDRRKTIPSLANRTGTDRSTRVETFGTAMERTYDLTRNYVWCALVFRMLCWLLLHDFHKKDVQLTKGESMGSRQSVYIV